MGGVADEDQGDATEGVEVGGEGGVGDGGKRLGVLGYHRGEGGRHVWVGIW